MTFFEIIFSALMEVTLIEMVILSKADRHQISPGSSPLQTHEISTGTCTFIAWTVVLLFLTGAVSFALFAKKLTGESVPKRIAEANEEIILT